MNLNSTVNLTFMAPCPYEEIYWIVSETIIALVASYFVYLFCTLCIFALKQKPKKEMKSLLILTIASVVLGMGRVIADEFVAFLGWQTDSFCIYSVSFSIGLYYLSFSAVYTFLWIRQYFFYQKPMLRSLVSKKLLFISRATLVVLVLLGLALATLFQIPEVTGWDYRATATGCRDNEDEQDFELVPFFFVIVSVVGQVSLLGLLLYPFLATQKNRKKLDTAGSQFWIARPPSPKENTLLRRAVLASYQEKVSIFADPNPNLKTQQNNLPAPVLQFSQSEDEVFAADASGTCVV